MTHIRFSVEQVAKKHNASMAQVSLAWIMSRPGMSCLSLVYQSTSSRIFVVGVTAPIVGTTSLDNLNDLLGK